MQPGARRSGADAGIGSGASTRTGTQAASTGAPAAAASAISSGIAGMPHHAMPRGVACTRIDGSMQGAGGSLHRRGVGLPVWLLGMAALLLAMALPARATEPLELAPGRASVPLSGSIGYRHDLLASDGAGEAFKRARAGQFSPLPGGNPAFG